MLIISLFSLVVPSLTRQLYSNLKSVHITTGIGGRFSVRTILESVKFKAIALLNPSTILYSLLASTLLVTLLHFTEF
jgi:hypothetical protein